tara:strand:+ start:681 stop:1445 length:765 start_codon:yes stop_codon:yes gene_type:complete
MPVNAFPKKIYTNDSVIAYYQTCDLTDGTWTLLDSTNMIDTVANAGTGNNIRLNAVGVANNELQIVGSGGTSVAPRWYKPAFFDDGTPVLGTDAFVLTVSYPIKGSTLNNMRYVNWGFGISAVPTSTNVATINHNLVGTGWNFANADADAFGVFFSDAVAGNADPVVATDVHCLSTIPMVGGNGNLTVSAVDASDLSKATGAAASSSTNYGAGQLFVQLTFGARGNSRTYTAGMETLIKLNYKFSRVNKVSAGF